MATKQADIELAKEMAECYADPLRYVMTVYPWGKGELYGFDGPRQWQRDFLVELGREVHKRGFDGIHPVEPIQFATASGHGIGKSALTSWIAQWIMDTRPFAKGIITANTGDQLETKTWAEMGKWHRMNLTRHLWVFNSSRAHMRYARKGQEESWRCDALTWKEEKSEAFAGLHAVNSTPFYINDEASLIPDAIWEVQDGGLTDGEPIRLVFGNPTRNTGRFRECFRKFRHAWITKQIDSRDVEGTNKELLNQWVRDWGEDSDYVRRRVRGIFPRSSSYQFIGEDVVTAAQRRPLVEDRHAPIIIGLDVARSGDCQSVIYPRQGRDARTYPPKKFRERDSVKLAGYVAETVQEFERFNRTVAGVIIEGDGLGGPICDILRSYGLTIHEVNTGTDAHDKARHYNLRAEMWNNMRDWLKGGCIPPDDQELYDDLIGPDYELTGKTQIKLERKEDMQTRGLPSPDTADALALSFAVPIRPDFPDTTQFKPAFANGGKDFALPWMMN